MPRTLALAARDIKLAHSVFALPFAILAAFLARPESSPLSRFAAQLTLITLCMVFARTWAMLVNRLADIPFDAANPRTQHRAFASGQLSRRQGWTLAAAAAILFLLLTLPFYLLFHNPWPTILALPVLAWIALYSYTKRFTPAAHIFLGSALAASPLAAAIAINPAALSTTPALWLIAAMVLAWVAGFDILYALQDIDFDRAHGLFSIPARAGRNTALWISRALHAAALCLLILAWFLDPRLQWLFAAALLIVAALLAAVHLLLTRRPQLGPALFTLNGIVSCLLGALGIVDVVI